MSIAATNQSESGTRCSGRAQQAQKLRDGVRFADTSVRAGNEEAHATCRAKPGCSASIVFNIERKIFAPSALPSRASHARSGCGINPNTLRSRLQTPAMFSIDPFGFAFGTI